MYKRATEGLTLDLADASRGIGKAKGDVYVDIEDLIDGGAGNDILTGGGHYDSFFIGAVHDVITDFRPGIKTIWDGMLSAVKLVNTFAEMTEAGVGLDFGTDASLTLQGRAGEKDMRSYLFL
ncbi:hypothetical protein LA6_006175 (plasmid) [Marinibacterium anthonyi]|nr:hypothetical protein LA6_006175 [Marinibacterium anthonyi]